MMVHLFNMCRELHPFLRSKAQNLHPTTGFVLRTEDGQEVGGPKERSSYDDVVAAFGQPVSSTDSANPGDGVNVWATDNGDIMAFFRNNNVNRYHPSD